MAMIDEMIHLTFGIGDNGNASLCVCEVDRGVSEVGELLGVMLGIVHENHADVGQLDASIRGAMLRLGALGPHIDLLNRHFLPAGAHPAA